MDVVWSLEGGDVRIREVAGALPSHAYTTAATVLNRLSGKGVRRRHHVGRVTVFEAIGSEAIGSEADRAVKGMLDALGSCGERAAALARFARALPPDEAHLLRRSISAPTTL